MEVVDALQSVLIILALVVCVVGIWALAEVIRSARSVRMLADDTRERLVPLLEKLDVSIDAFNAELLRVDLIVTKFEEVSDRLSNASDTISDLANVPEKIAGGIADRVRSWRTRRAASAEGPDIEEGATRPEATEEQAAAEADARV